VTVNGKDSKDDGSLRQKLQSRANHVTSIVVTWPWFSRPHTYNTRRHVTLETSRLGHQLSSQSHHFCFCLIIRSANWL